MVYPDPRWQQKTMKGPYIKILLNIDFQNLDLWLFLRRGWGSERIHGMYVVTKLISKSSQGKIVGFETLTSVSRSIQVKCQTYVCQDSVNGIVCSW